MASTNETLGKFKKPRLSGETPFTDTTDRCERLGYVPSNKRMAALISAGLSLQVTRDELWDIVAKNESALGDLPPLPPLRRHLDADLADLSQLSREYAQRRRVIEARIREQQLARRAKVAAAGSPGAAVQPSAGAGEPPGGAPRAPEGSS